MITVAGKSVRAFWERHPDHPGGEVFIAGDCVAQVANTRAVRAAIQDGRLVELPVIELVADNEPPQPAPVAKSVAKRQKKGGNG